MVNSINDVRTKIYELVEIKNDQTSRKNNYKEEIYKLSVQLDDLIIRWYSEGGQSANN